MTDIAPKYAAMNKERADRHRKFIRQLTNGAKSKALANAKKWQKFRYASMKAILFTILVFSATQSSAWGVYRGRQARVYYHNPYAASGPHIIGSWHPSSPQYGRALRGHWGGYRAYGGGGDMGWYWNMRQTWALEDIADGVGK